MFYGAIRAHVVEGGEDGVGIGTAELGVQGPGGGVVGAVGGRELAGLWWKRVGA